VFRRKPAGRAAATAAPETPPRPGAKGRPTPKRREAEKQRKTNARAPKDRKEAVRLARAKAREDRLRSRRALVSGDERYLPARDRGPVKAYARDFVDARRSVAEYFLPLALLIFLLNLVRNPQVLFVATIVWLTLIVLMIGDSVLLVRRLKARLRDRFPQESLRGVGPYVLLRSTQLRRLRLPKPRVKPGASI
jgi:Protein of unknown function (DUF3043)